MQGCVVVRKAFAEDNADAVATFLQEYGASIEGMTADIEGTAAKIEANGIFTKAAVAAKAIPCLLYTSPSPRDHRGSRMPSAA